MSAAPVCTASPTLPPVTAAVPTPETAPTDPVAAYGISKLMIEKYLALHEHLHRTDYRVLRVTNPFGPFQGTAKNQGIIAALIALYGKGNFSTPPFIYQGF